MSFHHSSICLILASIFAVTATAQVESEKPKGSGKDRGPAVRLLLLAPGSNSMELFAIAGEVVIETFMVGTVNLGAPVFPGARVFNLAIKSASTESGFEKIATVTLPQTGSSFIVLLEPQNGKTFIPYAISSRQQGFEADATLFFNATDVQVGAVFGKKRSLIRQRRVEIVAAPPRQGDLPYYPVELYHPEGDGLKLFASSRWLHREKGRNYVFIFREHASGRVDYQTFHEDLEHSAVPP